MSLLSPVPDAVTVAASSVFSLSFSLPQTLSLFLQLRHGLRLAHPQSSAGTLGHPRFHHLRRGDAEAVFAVSPADVCAGEFVHLIRSQHPRMAHSDWRPLRFYLGLIQPLCLSERRENIEVKWQFFASILMIISQKERVVRLQVGT